MKKCLYTDHWSLITIVGQDLWSSLTCGYTECVHKSILCDQFGVYSSPILVLLCDHLTNQVSVHLSEA